MPRATLLHSDPSDDVYARTVARMGTLVTIHVVGLEVDADFALEREVVVERAFEWFRRIEECCSRFDAGSELMQLTARVGVPVPVSEILYEAIRFALAVAEESEGAFDPTVGHSMEARGFNREYRTGDAVRTVLETGRPVSYRDVRLDPDRTAVTLVRPLILDLGAVAKGLAIDMAARELRPLENFAVNAGGDLYLGGHNREGAPWSIGIRHPRQGDRLIESVRVSDRAVCTSGDYERRSPCDEGAHHIIDPRTGASANALASVTVVAPTAMAADALATAAFVLGPHDGIRLLESQGVEGLMMSPTLERYSTRGMRSAQTQSQEPTAGARGG